MNLRGKRTIVVGLGKSGLSAAKLCMREGASVIGTDSAPLERLSSDVSSAGIELSLGGHAGVEWTRADLIVISPGVPFLPEIRAARDAGVEVIGEMELASRFISAPIAAVGGTNGKSTTTTLLARMLEATGKRVFAGANLGTPACDAAGDAHDYVVFEVSSFQLEHAPSFRPKVCVLLNVSEDHLDRYDSFAEYAHTKGNAFVNQGAGDVAVVPEGDEVCVAEARRGKGRVVTFGAQGDYDVSGRSVVERASGTEFSLAHVALFGRHNLENGAAAVAAARGLGASEQAVNEGFRAFVPLGHRMALVGEVRGIRFYDDSKGTNVGASVTALRGLEEPRAVLIAGGRDKRGSYEPLVQALTEKGRAVVVIGEAADRIVEAVGESVPVEKAASMTEAVERALALTQPGDAVLLSPACSSFDMFSGYAERGDRFAQAVRALAEVSS
jgi:UDP-N-acetylmuramoylalanine--D-glutamate ligase